MSREDIETKIKEIVGQVLACSDDDMTEETTLGKLGADSLDLTEIVTELEEEFDVRFPDDGGTSIGHPPNEWTFKILADFVEGL